ncbi:MAG: patatin-like phospholipase family protein [Gemmatimonadetes bacterium]|nr:patatin-like phospholipase family protein [Gemmatimonadota bacterium]
MTRVVCVLSGGSAKGAAHVGAIRALADWELQPAHFVGTSIGAVVAASFASGLPYEEVLRRITTLSRRDFAALSPHALLGPFASHLFQDGVWREAVEMLVPARGFDDLQTPLTVTAVDAQSGDLVLFGAGGRSRVPLVDALCASCALPLYFPPVRIGDRQYLDGGVRAVFPLDVAADLGDGAVQLFLDGVVRVVDADQLARVLIDHQPPHTLQEAIQPDDIARVPGRAGFERAEVHLVQAERVRTELGDHVVGVDDVFECFAHFGGGLCDRIAGGGFDELVLADLLDFVYCNKRFVLALVRKARDHSLVEQLPERFVGRDVAEVEEHLVPEPRVEQVQHRVLGPADVEVHAGVAHPVALGVFADESLGIAVVAVAQEVPARAGPAGHGVGLARDLCISGQAPRAIGHTRLASGGLDPVVGLGEQRLGRIALFGRIVRQRR